MAKFKTYNQFVNEQNDIINEFMNPITLAFAIAGIGIAFQSDISAAYRRRKVSKAGLKELKYLLAKAESRVKKLERKGDGMGAAEAQEEVENIEARIKSMSNDYNAEEEIINNFEKDKKTRKELEDELRKLDAAELKRTIQLAKKNSRDLK